MADGTSVGSLYYDLEIDDGKLSGQLRGADDKVKDFGEKLSSGLKKAAIGFAAVGAGLTLIAKNATDFTVDQVKSAKALGTQIGVTTVEASRLSAAMQRMGVDAQSTQSMFGICSKQINAAAKETDNAKNKFAQIGIAIKDSAGNTKGFVEILQATSDKFKSMPDGVEKTALAMELFGRSGKDMIKVLNLGSEGIQQLEKDADRLGLTLSADSIGKVQAYIKSQKDLKQSTDALKIFIGTATAPVLTSFNEKLNEVALSMINADTPFKGLIVNALAFGGPIFAATGGLLAFAANLVQVAPAIAAIANPVGLILVAVLALAAAWFLLLTHWQEVSNFLNSSGLGQAIQALLIVMLPFITIPMEIALHWQGLWNFLKEIWDWVTNNWPLLLAALGGPFILAAALILSHLQQIKDTIKDAASDAWNWLYDAGKSIIDGLVKGIKDKVGDAIRAVKDVGKNMIKAARDALDWHSPSKKFIAAGKSIGQGLALGIKDTSYLALDAMNSLAGNVLSPNISLAPSGAGIGGASSGTVAGSTVVNIGTVNDRSDADYILRRMDRNQENVSRGVSPT